MALKYWLFLSQIAGYSIGLILSFCIVVPMCLLENDFNGNCMFFSKADLHESNEKLSVQWSSKAYCIYVLVIGVFMNITCSVQLYRFLKHLHRGSDSPFLPTLLEAILCMILSAAVVTAAIIVTVGFVSWCDAILESFVSCEDANGLRVDGDDKVDTSGFYIQVNIVQFGTWAAFATSIGLAVLSSLKLFLYHQQEEINKITNPRQRQRLLTRCGFTSQPGPSTPLLQN